MGWFDGWFGSKTEDTTELFTPAAPAPAPVDLVPEPADMQFRSGEAVPFSGPPPQPVDAFPGYGAPYTEIEPEPDGDLGVMRLGLNVRTGVRNYYDKIGSARPGYEEIDHGNNAVANSYYAEQQAYLDAARIAQDPARAADSAQAKEIMAYYEKDMAESFGKDTTEQMLQMYFPERAKKAAPAEAATALQHYAE